MTYCVHDKTLELDYFVRLTKQEIIGPNFCNALTVVELTGKDLQPFMVRLGYQELSTDRKTKMTPCSLGKAVSKEIPPCNFLFALVSVRITFTHLQVPDTRQEVRLSPYTRLWCQGKATLGKTDAVFCGIDKRPILT